MKKLLSAAIIGGLIAVAATKIGAGSAPPASPSHLGGAQSAFDRVTATKTLRCAYAAYYPFLVVDKQGQLTGIFYDVMNEAGKRLNLKVEWAEEVTYGNINAGFVTGRYDAFCAGLWPAGSRAASTIFSRAVSWAPITVWVRGDDARFDGQMEKLNDPSSKIAYIEGDATASMVDAVFPKAGHVVMSQSNNIPEEILQVTSGKADALFSDYLGADQFMEGSPGGLKDLSPGKPVLTYPVTVGFNQNEMALRDMLNVVLADMDRDGTVEKIVQAHLGSKAKLLYQEKSHFEPYGEEK